MSKGQMLRALVKQRLSLAAEEIFDLFERTIAEYEEQLCRSKEENERQRKLLDAVFKPQLRLHRAGVQQLSLSKEEVPPEQQDQSSSLNQEDPPELPHIKEEQEELWTNQEEADITELTVTPAPVKSEDDDEEKPQSSQLHQSQTEQMETKADGEDCGGPEPARTSDPDRFLQLETEDKIEDFSETEVSDGDREETREPQLDLNDVISESMAPINSGKKRFSCSDCGKRFGRKTHLTTHMRIHTGERPFGCSVCTKRFAHKATLTNHMVHHTGEKPFSCSECGKRCNRKANMSVHMVVHTGEKRFSCKVCDRRFTFQSSVKCHKCVGGQSSQPHQRQTEQMETDADGGDCRGPEPGRNSDPDGCLQPETDDKTEDFSRTKVSDDDWNETRDPQSGFNSPKNDEIPVIDGGCDTEEKPVISSDCAPSGEKPFCCCECDKRFGLKQHLLRHIKIHTGEKPFTCRECGKKFSHKHNVTRHMRMHSGEKPFSCSVCGKRFTQRSGLTQHMGVHTGKKQFRCPDCGVRYTQKETLTRHMVLHVGEKPFNCSVCGKRFALKKGLTQHMAMHSGEKRFCCSVCGMQFARKESLTWHMVVHTGEKPCCCSVCGKRFTRKGSLTQHMAIHTGEKRFNCSDCDKRFTWRNQLINHQCVVSQSSQLHQRQPEEGRDGESLAEQKKTDIYGQSCGGAEPHTDQQQVDPVETYF